MKQKRFNSTQIVAILHEAESGVSIRELCRKYGMSEQSFFRWKKKYGGLDTSDVVAMKAMGEENSRLKKLVANQALQIDALKEAVQKKW